jgi:hypothetical protein
MIIESILCFIPIAAKLDELVFFHQIGLFWFRFVYYRFSFYPELQRNDLVIICEKKAVLVFKN